MQRLGFDVSTITLEDPARGGYETEGMNEREAKFIYNPAQDRKDN